MGASRLSRRFNGGANAAGSDAAHFVAVAEGPEGSDSGDDKIYDAVIVGGGPRAVATVERIDARVREAGATPASVLVIDAIEVGAGATWRTDQTEFFLNNTTSDATTIYPDASTPIDGPAGDGPTFVEWAREVAERGHHKVDWAVREARGVAPGSFPSRRLQGVYYNDQLERVSGRGGVRLTRVLGTVVDLERGSASDAARDLEPVPYRQVQLRDGRRFRGRTVVLAQGMVQALPTQSVQGFSDAAARLGLLYIAPGMPAEQPWQSVPAAEAVIARGLGANFFDVVAELTAGRGGRFEPVEGDAHGRLRYAASGAEPTIYATSRRGVPYRSKGDFGDQKVARYVPRLATGTWFADVARTAEKRPRSIDFAAELWPVVAAELGLAWVSALEAQQPGALAVSLVEAEDRLRVAARQDVVAFDSRQRLESVPHVDRTLSEIVTNPELRFAVEELRRPTRGARVSEAQWQDAVQRLIEEELQSLALPLVSPRQAVNRAMGAVRGQVSKLAVNGVLTPESEVRDVHGWFNADGLFLASGPPASRVREVLALIEAGVVRLVGPDTNVFVDEGAGEFRAVSSITGIEVSARTLVETRMSKGKVPTTSDPLLRRLLDRGDARVHTLNAPSTRVGQRTHRVPDTSGMQAGEAEPLSVASGPLRVETESLDAVPREAAQRPLALVDATGKADPLVLVLGIPASSTQPGSAIGASPGVPSPLLAGADRAAASVLAARLRVGASA